MFIIDQEEKVVEPIVENDVETTEPVVNEIVEEEKSETVVSEVVEETPETVEEETTTEKVEEETTEEIVEPVTEEVPVPKTPEDEMLALMDEHFARFKEGEIIEGVVVSVDERAVLVDIGFKSESPIQIKEFSASDLPEIGTRIKVFIDSVEDVSGRIKLSKKKADFYTNIEELNRLMDANDTVTGILRRRVKGGMIAEVMGLEAFLPGSQISIKPIPNLDQFIGKESEFKILKINRDRRNIIVSRKKVLEEKRQIQLSTLKEHLDIGSELDGEVRNITDYGAFIDLGGIDGLLHITDMSWGHINHPSDMLNIGDKVKVKVLEYDEENQKVSLGLKQLVPHPWDNIEKKYPEGSIVSGKVVNILPYGAFIELESGVEGLVHVSEMSWTKKVKHPKHIVKMGENIKAIVLAISKDDRRISLGIKQMEPNPWLMIEERYPIGSELSGHIKSLTPFGAFVEIEDNIEGLIHISDISWTKRIYHPREIFKKGQEIGVKVLSIDSTLHRIALGVKQLTSDPWENLDEFLPINTEIKAIIVKIISKGVLVDVIVEDNVVEGFVPLSHLAIPGLRKASTVFKVGEEMPLKIIELDLENRRLILSVKAYFFARDKKELQEYIDGHKVENAHPDELDPHANVEKMVKHHGDTPAHESNTAKEEVAATPVEEVVPEAVKEEIPEPVAEKVVVEETVTEEAPEPVVEEKVVEAPAEEAPEPVAVEETVTEEAPEPVVEEKVVEVPAEEVPEPVAAEETVTEEAPEPVVEEKEVVVEISAEEVVEETPVVEEAPAEETVEEVKE